MIKKLLIANRGEIALRIIRACRPLGIKTVAVYSKGDENSLHTVIADEKICIGSSNVKDSYLNINRIISAALTTNSDAIHPGYGFLSENSEFAKTCEKFNINFIGPSSDIIKSMGNKSKARNTMEENSIPIVPGTKSPIFNSDEALIIAEEIGYPVIIKSSFGGGGKGMRLVEKKEEFIELFNIAQREAENSFGNGAMYIEKYIRNPRHIEIQILGDKYGNIIQLGERDCSIQRKHQKMIEESPSPAINSNLRKEIGLAALRAAKAVNYVNAGTIEFLLDSDNNFYFMEMNTRVQVEHPVTETVTGIDIIKEQIRIASGLPLSYKQEDVNIKGHAIECRINAEIPAKNFIPSPGTIKALHLPSGFGVRIDTALYMGYKIPSLFDSMIAKIIVHGNTRDEAIENMKATLDELVISGIETNTDFLYSIMDNNIFKEGKATTSFMEEVFNV